MTEKAMTEKRLKRNLATEESRNFWDAVDRIAARVDAWPAWMRGEIQEKDEAPECR